MKKTTLKLTSLLLLLTIIFTSASCTGRNVTNPPSSEPSAIESSTSGIPEQSPVSSEEDGSSSLPTEQSSPSSSSEATPPVTPEDVIPPSNTPPVSLPETNDVSPAAAQGLRSAVSVYATFNINSYWGSTSGTSAGSGVIYRLDANTGSAFIITNYHVVYNGNSSTANRVSDNISIFLFGLEYADYAIPATYVGGSANYDLAILYVENSEILKTAAQNGSVKAVSVANSDKLAAGQTAIAIGNPESQGISVTTGIVSVDSENISMNAVNGSGTISLRVVRIDTAVNSGNSGGGLFNAKGELIGIVNAKMNSSDVENIGYAIPSNVARAIADNIIDYCFGKECESVMRGILGITITTSSISTSYDPSCGMIIRTEKIIVHEVNTGGLGESILKAGDIICSISVGDTVTEITRQHHLLDAMLDVRVGDTVSLTILRNGEQMTVSTVITEECLTAY